MKIGCDIVYVPRFKKILARTPAVRRRIFLPREERGASAEKLAGIFAAKEAIIKALGTPAGRWHDIEIFYEKSGRPKARFSRNLKPRRPHDLSVAHDGDYAITFVIFQ